MLSVPWDTAHERTKRRHLRKAEQCIFAMLDVLAPANSQDLWKALCDRHAACKERQDVGEERSEKEMELLGAFAESYLNAQHWSTRRQILSLMADKLSLKELRELFQQSPAIATTLLDATGCYMEELLLFLAKRIGE